MLIEAVAAKFPGRRCACLERQGAFTIPPFKAIGVGVSVGVGVGVALADKATKLLAAAVEVYKVVPNVKTKNQQK